MCTVSLVALNGGGYLLAANRDEYVTRGVARPPERAAAGSNRFVAPRDADAGGTWIAVDRGGRSLCLLNGDRPAATPPPADARSRGLLVIDLLEDPRPPAVAAALEEMHRRGRLAYRPFKLVAVAPRADGAGVEVLRAEFDGRELTLAPLDAPHVETSNGLDPDGVARARRASFEALARRLPPAPQPDAADRWRDALLLWHRSHADGEERGGVRSVCVHRPQIRTVSSTLIDVRGPRIVMRYQPGAPCEEAAAVEQSP